MKTKVLNSNELSTDDIEITEERVKVLLVNSDNQLLLCKIDGIYHFVGGHPENKETTIECAIREIKEETGIDCCADEMVPFLQLKEFHTNYFGMNKKALSIITYLCINTDQIYDYDNRKLDSKEREKNFILEYVLLNKTIDTIESTRSLAKAKNKEFLINEMCDVISEFKSIYDEKSPYIKKNIR